MPAGASLLRGRRCCPCDFASGPAVAEADRRIPAITAIPAVVRFLSVEPLLEPVRLDLRGIAWVIVGGESGPGARPMLISAQRFEYRCS